MKSQITDPQQIQSLVNSVDKWYHAIEVAPGIFTPGVRNCQVVLDRLDSLGLPQDCQSLRVLDIGCRDGFFSFEMENRGAEVVAIDYADVNITGFSVVSQIKNSQIKYVTDNVYQLNSSKYGFFDIVLFLGVLYHLRNPLLALDKIQKIIKPDGLLFVETEITTNFILGKINTPVWQFYPGASLNNDATNKWAPNRSGLKAVVEEAQFKVINDLIDNNRAYIAAKAEQESEKEYFRQLDSSANLLDEGESIFGGIDEVTSTQITGWAINSDEPELSVVVVVWQNNRAIATGIANFYRQDLEEAGSGSGKHGFAIAIERVSDRYPLYITVTSSRGEAFPDASSYWTVKGDSDRLKPVELTNSKAHALMLSGEEPAMKIEGLESEAELGSIWERIQKEWQILGESEPYWSVLSAEEFKRANLTNIEEFYQTGKEDLARIFATLQRNGIDYSKSKTCLEYGCGLGRVTLALAEKFDRVYGYDISASHLESAAAYCSEQNISNIDFQHLNNLDRLKNLPKVDFVYSVMVLQHNPPPIIGIMIREMIKALNPGGAAMFQVPTYRPNYSFSLSQYLEREVTESDIEMHVLPQRKIFEIIGQENGEIIEVVEDRFTSSLQQVSNTFLVRKKP